MQKQCHRPQQFPRWLCAHAHRWSVTWAASETVSLCCVWLWSEVLSGSKHVGKATETKWVTFPQTESQICDGRVCQAPHHLLDLSTEKICLVFVQVKLSIEKLNTSLFNQLISAPKQLLMYDPKAPWSPWTLGNGVLLGSKSFHVGSGDQSVSSVA